LTKKNLWVKRCIFIWVFHLLVFRALYLDWSSWIVLVALDPLNLVKKVVVGVFIVYKVLALTEKLQWFFKLEKAVHTDFILGGMQQLTYGAKQQLVRLSCVVLAICKQVVIKFKLAVVIASIELAHDSKVTNRNGKCRLENVIFKL
jgi:hypothetical protein